MSGYWVTKQVAELLGITVANLQGLIKRDLIKPPPTDASNRYVWRDSHVRAARKVVAAIAARKAARAKK